MNIHTRIIRSTTHAHTASAAHAAGANVNADLNISPPPPPPPPPSKLTFDSASRSVRLPFFRQVHSSNAGRNSSFRRLVIVLLAGVFSLLAVPASAQSNTLPGQVWSATLTVAKTGIFFGCTTQTQCSTGLTDNDFSVGGQDFTVTQLVTNGVPTTLTFLVSHNLNNALKALNLCVGTTAYSLSGGTGKGEGWPLGSGDNNWSVGDTISLKIASSCTAAPTVNLSAAPNPVPEGSSVTITATLSAALTSNVRIPLTITRGSAEAADIGNLAAITIPSGQTSATGSLPTNQDTDDQDETLTVALGTLPSSVTAGTDNSVAITITDDDKPAPTDLSALTAKSSTDGSTFTALALTPATFAAATTAYSASVTNAVTHLILTPTAAQSGATIQVGKSGSLNSVASGVDSNAIPLSVGANAILVEVTASGGAKNTYTVSITRAAASTPTTPTVSLSVTPQRVNEGSSVTVTATLSAALTPNANTSIPITLTAGSAEPGDYGTLTAIAIASGATTGTGTFTTNHDLDTDHETITVALGSPLPSGVVAGSANSVVVTIHDDEAPSLQSEPLHQTTLPEVARAVAGRVTSAISTRVGRALNGGGSGGVSASLGGQSTLAGVLKTHAPVLLNENRPLRDLLHGSDFVLPFHTREEGGGLLNTSLWGSGEYRNFSGENDGVDFDGSLYGAQIGVDHKVRENLLAGVALSWSEGELEYEDSSGGGAGGISKGDYEIDLLAIHPYLGWRSGQRHWWATVGYGTGEVEITPEDGESSSNDVTLQSVSLGGSGLLWSRDDANVRLKGGIARTDLEVEKTAQVAAMTVETTLIRFAAEASSRRHLSGGGHLSPSISLGLRHDGGDGADGNTSTGAEFHGGVRYANPKTGWNAETSVHTLLGRSDYEEWGILGTLRLSPSAGGHGLSFEMSPGYGNGGGGGDGTGRIWSNGLRGDAIPTAPDPSGRLEMRMGYGLSTPGERDGLLTPWSGLTLHDDGKLYRLGLDWSSGGQFTLRLHGERRENENADADHAVLLKGEARF